MTIGGVETNAVIFYDRDTRQVCGMITDEDFVIPENCEMAIFRNGMEPIFKQRSVAVELSGTLLPYGLNGLV